MLSSPRCGETGTSLPNDHFTFMIRDLHSCLTPKPEAQPEARKAISGAAHRLDVVGRSPDLRAPIAGGGCARRPYVPPRTHSAGHSRCSSCVRENTLSGNPMKNASRRDSVRPSAASLAERCALFTTSRRQRAEVQQHAARVRRRRSAIRHARPRGSVRPADATCRRSGS